MMLWRILLGMIMLINVKGIMLDNAMEEFLDKVMEDNVG